MSDDVLRRLLDEVAGQVADTDLIPRVNEGRSRRRRRRRVVVALTTTVAVAAVGSYVGLLLTSRPPAGPAVLSIGAASSPPPPEHGPSLLPGAEVATRLRIGGVSLAAGGAFGQASQQLGGVCRATGCNPVVWRSAGGSPWRIVFEVSARFSGGDETLLHAPFGTLLFTSDEATQLWRSSDDGSHWTRQVLPPEMASQSLQSVSRTGRSVTAVMQDNRVGDTSTSSWTTSDGSHWHAEVSAG